MGFNKTKLELAIGGYSSGAHISMLYSYLLRNTPLPIKFIINIAGPVTLDPLIWKKLKTENDTLESIEPSDIEKALNQSKLIDAIDDEINILNATKKALTEAIMGLEQKPDVIMVDALTKIDTCGIPYISMIKGDAKVYSIACASIIAKVTRDRMMYEYDKVYPAYEFAKHKGYGTAFHINAIKENGLCMIHRKTFIKDNWLKK